MSTVLESVDESAEPFNSPEIVIVGGCGHVGLPLGIAFAMRNVSTVLYDTDASAVKTVNAGTMPFLERGAPEVLKSVIGSRLVATDDISCISNAETIIVVIGTPVDEHSNPQPHTVPEAVSALLEHMHDGQLLVLRSTVYPGVTAAVQKRVIKSGKQIDVAFCPERIAEGRALEELPVIPQIISGMTESAEQRAEILFKKLTNDTVTLTDEEAELAKLFTNVWRYAQFAVANQLYMVANSCGVDYERVRSALALNYPRAATLPKAGFAAGPCLLKDAMQLANFDNHHFTLGNAAVAVNEGLPGYVVKQLSEQYDLEHMTVGILGMAFKGESDDTRSSLSYKLKRILRFQSREVLTADTYVTTDDTLISEEEVIANSDLIIIGTPHSRYASLRFHQPVVDIWNILGKGVRV